MVVFYECVALVWGSSEGGLCGARSAKIFVGCECSWLRGWAFGKVEGWYNNVVGG